MEYIELSETMFPNEQFEWRPLELTEDVNTGVYGQSGSVYEEAIKAGEQEYKEQTAAYEKSFAPTENTPENRAAVEHFKRLLGRG
jgi:hypothetical protein